MKEYKFLKVARVVFIIFAWIALIFGIIGGITIFATGGAIPVTSPDGITTQSVPRIFGIFPLLQGATGFFVFFAISQIIKVLLETKDSSAGPTAK